MRLIIIALATLIALPGLAGQRADGEGLSAGVEALHEEALAMLGDLPERKLAEVRRAPRKFIEAAADLIYGFGVEGTLGPEGLTQFIAIRRAHMRARVMRRFLLADLDDDGWVSAGEIDILIGAEAATARGRLKLAFRSADGAFDTPDGRLDLDEMRAYATDVANKEIDDGDADLIRSILMFDLDGDGRISLDEVIEGVEALTGPV